MSSDTSKDQSGQGAAFAPIGGALRANHKEVNRSKRRAKALLRHIPPNGVGAEIGVFWGHFSERLLAWYEPKTLHLVDPWDRLHGDFFPDWGDYTDFGRLSAHQAKSDVYEIANRYPDIVQVHESYSGEFLDDLPDQSLDWVYLDAIEAKLKDDGIIFGDDYYLNEKSKHHGVLRAVNEFAHRTGRKLVLEDNYQYVLLPRDAKRP